MSLPENAVAGWRIEAADPVVDAKVAEILGRPGHGHGHPGEVIDLLTPTQLHRLPLGTMVLSIFGEEKVVGRDSIDEDTRGGFTAWGIPCPRNDETVHVDD